MRPDLDLDDDALRTLVRTFYAAVRRDPLLAPVFERAVHDWDSHLETLTDFWSSVMLGSGRYSGRPMQKHAAQAAHITPEHFDRWLAIWRETTAELFPEPLAAALQAKAGRIGESLRLGIAFQAGQLP